MNFFKGLLMCTLLRASVSRHGGENDRAEKKYADAVESGGVRQ